MKRFDKGYIFSSLLSDFLGSLVISFLVFEEFFLEEEVVLQDIIAAVPIFAAVLLVVYACFIAYRVMYYRTSGYELTETEIKCKRGVFFRKRSVLDYKKVHAINKKQNIIHKIFGIAVLTVDSGSANTAHKAEITIIEKEKIVNSLLDELNASKENGIRNDVAVAEKEEVLLSESDSLYSFTSKKKMLYTLINIVATAFFTIFFAVLAFVVISVCKLVLQLDSLGTWGEYLLSAFVITIGIMLLLVAVSFVGCMLVSFVRYHKFNITRRDNNIRISYGLLERHTNSFSYDRIKAVKISQGIVQRMLGFAEIKLEVIGYTNNTEENSSEIGVLVPFCKYEEIGEILGKILPDYVPEEKQTKSVAFFPFVSWFFLIFGGITGITVLSTLAIMIMLNAPTVATVITALSLLASGLIVLAVKSVSAALGYRINGIAVNDAKVTVYSGGFRKNITVFMAKNLIAVEDVTTPLRQKHGIASLVMHIKTNALTNEMKIHIQKDTLSEELEKILTV